MGVATAIWGTHGWIVLHAIAGKLDASAPSHRLMQAFFDILPCVHCREKSRDEFASLARRYYRHRPNWIMYKLHEAVNIKLMRQELQVALDAKHPDGPRGVLKNWSKYQPEFEDLKVLSTDSAKFHFHLVIFVYYSLVDFDRSRAASFRKVFSFFARMYKYHFDFDKLFNSVLQTRIHEWHLFEQTLYARSALRCPLPVNHRVLLCLKSETTACETKVNA